MREIDGSEGEDNPPRVKRTRRAFPRLAYKASSACAEMLWFSELARVRSQAIAVCFRLFLENFVQNNL